MRCGEGIYFCCSHLEQSSKRICESVAQANEYQYMYLTRIAKQANGMYIFTRWRWFGVLSFWFVCLFGEECSFVD